MKRVNLETVPQGVPEALADGCRLHVFLSGGGLRVARFERGRPSGERGVLKGYGEHPYFEKALAHAGEDYLAGQRLYSDVYGNLHTHYITGSSSPSSLIDAQILRGRTLDAWGEDGGVVCEIHGQAEVLIPAELKRAVAEDGVSRLLWRRGFLYEISPFTFPNGEPGTSVRIAGGRKPQNGADAWVYSVTKKGSGADFRMAVLAALDANEAEEDG